MRVSLLLAVLAGPALGQGHPCDGAETQVELNMCSYEAWELADEELNEAYAAAVEAAQGFDEWPEGRAEETLRAAQRAWIDFRDAGCEAEAATWDGGTGQPMARNGCLETQTLRRTEDLWAYAEAWGG